MRALTKYKTALIFIAVYLIYGITTAVQFSGDVKPAALLPFMILKYHTLYFDQAIQFIQDPAYKWGLIYNLVELDGHWVSVYPIVTSVILLPVYIIHLLILMVSNGSFEYYSVFSKTSADLLSSLCVTFFYLACKKILPSRTALVTTIIFAFGTITWAVSSQSLWQHGTSELLLVIILYCIIKNEETPDIRNFVIMGVVSGLFVFNRPPDIIMLLPVVYYLWINKDMIIAFFFWGTISSLPFLLYNLLIFGSVFGGYITIAAAYVTNHTNYLSVIMNIGALLISPNKGLFIYSPILIFSLVGIYFIFKNQENITRGFKNVVLLSLIGVLLLVFLYAIHLDTLVGGWTYGPRYLIAVLPVLCIFAGFGIKPWIENLNKNKAIVAFIICLLIISIILEVIGALFFPYNSWYAGKDEIKKPYVWETDDLLIVNSFYSGVNQIDSISLMIWPSLPPPVGYIVIWERGKKG